MTGSGLFPDVAPTTLALTLALLTGGVLLIVLSLGLANPVVWRLGVRNLGRRTGEALLLIAGLALSTVVITAAFGLADSLADSRLTDRLQTVGNIDESVTGPLSQVQIAAALPQIQQEPDVEAATALFFAPGSPTITALHSGGAIHDVDFYAVPPDFEAVYGPLRDLQGQPVHFADLAPGRVLVNRTAAQSLNLRPGDPLQIAFGDTVVTATVQALLDRDPAVTPGGADSVPAILIPLAQAQQIDPAPPNTLVVKNRGAGGMDDVGPGGSRSQAVVRALQHLFPGAALDSRFRSPDMDVLLIHPLKPDWVNYATLVFSKGIFLSAAGQQISWLPPIFTCVLVGAGMLLLALLMILLGAERRAELGMARAIGLQRGQVVTCLLVEGCGYGVIAAAAGVLLGIGATALELAVFGQAPRLAPGEALNNAVAVPAILPLHLWVSWQSLLAAACLSVLTTTLVVSLTGWWISRMTVVAALRDLDEPPARPAGRLLGSLLGLSLLGLGLRASGPFLALFRPVVTFSGPPAVLDILAGLLLLIGGAVLLALINADLLAGLLHLLLRPVPGLAPIRRLGLVYPLTFRFRTGITVALLSLITFLVLLLVTVNLGAVQEAQAAPTSGGFQLSVTVFGSQVARNPDLTATLAALQSGRQLRPAIAGVGLLRLLYDPPRPGDTSALALGLPGRPAYLMGGPPLVADDAFLAQTTLPLYARAAGFARDRQVWDAVRDHPGYAVLQYDTRVPGLPAQSNFPPFAAAIPTSLAPGAPTRAVTVIGLVPASTPWRILLAVPTAGQIADPPYTGFLQTYLFRLQPGVAEVQATSDLARILAADWNGIPILSLDRASQNSVTEVFTLFLAGQLALGLVFGAVALGVIASRAAVERQQQIGLLRALGFSRALVGGAFLLEFGFVAGLGLLVGTTLALGLAYLIARTLYQDFPLPLGPLALILAGTALIAFVSVALATRRAVRVPPAEALRYE